MAPWRRSRPWKTIPNVDANQRIVVGEHRGIVERHAFAHDAP